MSLVISSGYISRSSIAKNSYYASCIDDVSWKKLGFLANTLNLNCLKYGRFSDTLIFKPDQCYEILSFEIPAIRAGDLLAVDNRVLNDLENILSDFLNGSDYFLFFELKS